MKAILMTASGINPLDTKLSAKPAYQLLISRNLFNLRINTFMNFS